MEPGDIIQKREKLGGKSCGNGHVIVENVAGVMEVGHHATQLQTVPHHKGFCFFWEEKKNVGFAAGSLFLFEQQDEFEVSEMHKLWGVGRGDWVDVFVRCLLFEATSKDLYSM